MKVGTKEYIKTNLQAFQELFTSPSPASEGKKDDMRHVNSTDRLLDFDDDEEG